MEAMQPTATTQTRFDLAECEIWIGKVPLRDRLARWSSRRWYWEVRWYRPTPEGGWHPMRAWGYARTVSGAERQAGQAAAWEYLRPAQVWVRPLRSW